MKHPATKKVIVVQAPQLSEAELERCFTVDDSNRLWIATLQLIETMIIEAEDLAETCVANHGNLACYVGACERLKLLRDTMFSYRERGIAQAREPKKQPSQSPRPSAAPNP